MGRGRRVSLGYRHPRRVPAGFYHLENNNGINYGMPWIRPSSTSDASDTTLLPLDPDTYYGSASDYNDGSASYYSASRNRFRATPSCAP